MTVARRLLVVALAALAALVAFPSWAGAAGDARAAATTRPQRVLVVSLPAITWSDLRAHPMPNLERLLESSAVADLTTRAIKRRTDLGDGYTTLGAGTRAEGIPALDGFGFGVDERFGAVSAGDAYRTRTGRAPGNGLVDLGIASIVAHNDSLLYDAHVGALGDALAKAGWSRAVIANGDGAEPVVDATTYRRDAVAALMGKDGKVPGGRVDAGLLRTDPTAPFGVRLDQSAVTAAFDAVWKPRSVVLVEGSDLVREDMYRPFVSSRQRGVLLSRAMADTDGLIGALLARVDLSRDMVVVVGPAHSVTATRLTIAALHAPGVAAGTLQSATTRRDGFVQLVDVAPTILDRLGIDQPESMEGRPFEVTASARSLDSRSRALATADHEAAFRDRQTPVVTNAYIGLTIALVLIGTVVFAFVRRGRYALELAALSLLAFLPATFLAGFVRFDDLGAGPYWAFLLVVSFALALLFDATRRRFLDPLIAALGFIVVVHTLDIAAGGRLQLNTALGYSPIVAGRFQGMGNNAYSMYAAAGMLLAALLAHRLGGVRDAAGNWRRAPVLAAVGVLVVVVLVDGLPPLGSDVGGVLSIVPAAGVLTVVLMGWRVRWRTVLGWVGAGAAAVVVLGLLDLARPASSRTHLGRLFEKIGSGDFSGFTTVIARKLHENLSVITTPWLWIIPVTAAFIAFLVLGPPRRFGILRARVPELDAGLAGLAVLAVLGFALNDSGISIPGMMLGVLDAALVYLVARELDGDDAVSLAGVTAADPDTLDLERAGHG
ncbi:MAG TPA: hypothetical protein VIB48_25455 [Acidimicrobiia bacterium]